MLELLADEDALVSNEARDVIEPARDRRVDIWRILVHQHCWTIGKYLAIIEPDVGRKFEQAGREMTID